MKYKLHFILNLVYYRNYFDEKSLEHLHIIDENMFIQIPYKDRMFAIIHEKISNTGATPIPNWQLVYKIPIDDLLYRSNMCPNHIEIGQCASLREIFYIATENIDDRKKRLENIFALHKLVRRDDSRLCNNYIHKTIGIVMTELVYTMKIYDYLFKNHIQFCEHADNIRNLMLSYVSNEDFTFTNAFQIAILRFRKKMRYEHQFYRRRY